jgi:hypothetical protein
MILTVLMSKPSIVFMYRGMRVTKETKPQESRPDPNVAAQTGPLVKIAFHGTFRFCTASKGKKGKIC